jgi:hypothetical protein
VSYDPNGMDLEPFDPFGGESRTLAYTYRSRPSPGHGPTCQLSNPEVGCECGEDERQSHRREMRELREALSTAPSERDPDQARAVEFYLSHGGAR